MRARGTLLALICLLANVIATARASAVGERGAQSRNIVVDMSRYQAEFPRQISFSLNAHDDAAPINSVKLLYSVADQDQPALNLRPANFKAGRSVSAEYRWNLAQSYLPPGVEVSFSWEIRDEQGGVLQTEPQRFLLLDPRFQWKRLQGANITVYWYRGDEAFGRAVLDTAVQSLASFRNQVGATLQKPVRILVYGSQKDFQGILPPNSKEWIGGQAMADFNLILVPIEPGQGQAAELRRVLPHELSHLLIHQITKNPYSTLPAWLDEGLSVTNENALEPGLARVLKQAIKDKRLMSLRSLAGNFPTDPREAALAYGESHAAVLYVLKTYGRERFYRILTLIREGNYYEDALKEALGADLDKLDSDFQSALYSGSFTVPTSGGAAGAAQPAARAAPSGGLLQNVVLQVIAGVIGTVLVIYLALALVIRVRRRRRAAGGA